MFGGRAFEPESNRLPGGMGAAMHRIHRTSIAIVLLLLLSAANAPAQGDGPRALFARFKSAYEGRDAAAYGALFTPDFRYHFGDAESRAAHPAGWGRDDEIASARHLFEGFVNREGRTLPPASRIALDFGALDVRRDPEHPCDPEHYALVDARAVDLRIEFADGTAMRDLGRQAFWLARAPGDEADPGAWAIRRWDERPADQDLIASACPDIDSTATIAAALGAGGSVRLWTVAPNPSRLGAVARFAFEVRRAGDAVEASLYDVRGRAIAELAHGPRPAGRDVLVWDGRDVRGATAPSGVYFLRVRVGGQVRQERVVRIR